MKKALIVNTGLRKNVLKRTGVIGTIRKDVELTIITDQFNLDIFSSIKKYKIKLYSMNSETFLTLMDKHIWNVLLLSPFTGLSKAFCDRFRSVTGISCSLLDIYDEPIPTIPHDYYFEKLGYPVDWIHSIVSRGNRKYLIGINIGEEEHPTAKPTVDFLVELIKQLQTSINCKIILFGTEENKLREQMIINITNSLSQDLSSMVGNYEAPYMAQAISLCDSFISFDSFLMHLSLAIKEQTIGIFANTSREDTKDQLHLKSIFTRFKGECCPCNKDFCKTLEQSDKLTNCFMEVSVREIVDVVKKRLLRWK